MKTSLRYIIIALLCMSGYKALPQTGISLRLLNYTFQADTLIVNPGYRITIYTELTNVSQDTFESTLEFGLRNNQQDLSAIPGIFSKPAYSGKSIVLMPGETVPAIFSVKVDAPYYVPGPDVVVVWPISNSPILDSVVIPLIIDGPLSAKEKNTLAPRYIYSDGHLQLFETIENKFESVRIFSVNGQLLQSQPIKGSNIISMASLPKGLLLVQITYTDHRHVVVKIPNW